MQKYTQLWCGGYTFPGGAYEQYYNPFSLLRFLDTNGTGDWEIDPSARIIGESMKKRCTRKYWSKLMNGKQEWVEFNHLKFDIEEVDLLHDMTKGIIRRSQILRSSLFAYVIDLGYLTFSKTEKDPKEGFFVKIPNKEKLAEYIENLKTLKYKKRWWRRILSVG